MMFSEAQRAQSADQKVIQLRVAGPIRFLIKSGAGLIKRVWVSQFDFGFLSLLPYDTIVPGHGPREIALAPP